MDVLDYFAGERLEMLIAIAVFLVVGSFATWLFVSSRTVFALALMMTVVIFGGLMGAGLASLLIRDHALCRTLIGALQSEQNSSAAASEKLRIALVLSKFKYYRYAAVVFGLLAGVGLTFSERGWTHGVAAGLLLVVLAQVAVDHFSERRAHTYLEKLTIV